MLQYAQYQRFATEEYVLQAGGVFCPQPGCGMGIIAEPECRRITCTNGCGVSAPLICLVPYESYNDGVVIVVKRIYYICIELQPLMSPMVTFVCSLHEVHKINPVHLYVVSPKLLSRFLLNFVIGVCGKVMQILF